ncbi:MAG: hypothetical protein QXU92_04565 [Candidatus Diapherotrites archaeon]
MKRPKFFRRGRIPFKGALPKQRFSVRWVYPRVNQFLRNPFCLSVLARGIYETFRTGSEHQASFQIVNKNLVLFRS